MGDIVGRLTCPICGEPMQDLKVNKNNKLYCYCDNGCKSQLNSKNSRSALAALRSGKSVAIEKIGYIRAVGDNSANDRPVLEQARKKDSLAEELGI